VAIGVAAAQTATAIPASVRQRLAKCYRAVNALYVGSVKSRTSLVPKLNRQVRAIYVGPCDADSSVLGSRAGQALFDLALGLGDYQQYLVDVAFDRQDKSLLRQAVNEISKGKAEARKVLK
jgi:hypothetical protein